MRLCSVHFKDAEKAKEILAATTPRDHKRLGRQVQNYDQDEWTAVGDDYMFEGIKAKFSQNSELRRQLLLTCGWTLVEASPRDTKWGIGTLRIRYLYSTYLVRTYMYRRIVMGPEKAVEKESKPRLTFTS